MTKAATIREHLQAVLSPVDIARRVGVAPDYVRAVRNRERMRRETGCAEYPRARARKRERTAIMNARRRDRSAATRQREAVA
jgi:hypothetical protein